MEQNFDNLGRNVWNLIKSKSLLSKDADISENHVSSLMHSCQNSKYLRKNDRNHTEVSEIPSRNSKTCHVQCKINEVKKSQIIINYKYFVTLERSFL